MYCTLYIHRYIQVPEEGIGSLGTGVTRSYELPCLNSGNQAWSSGKSSKPLTSEYTLQHSFKMWVFDIIHMWLMCTYVC